MTFGNRLKELRKAKGLTQIEISKDINFSQSAITAYENGKREPNFEVLQKLATYFNVSTDYLLGKTDALNPPVTKTNSTDLLDFLFHDEPEFLAKIRSIDIKGKINEPGTIFKLTERQKDRIKDIIRLTVKEAEMNGGHAKTIIKSK